MNNKKIRYVILGLAVWIIAVTIYRHHVDQRNKIAQEDAIRHQASIERAVRIQDSLRQVKEDNFRSEIDKIKEGGEPFTWNFVHKGKHDIYISLKGYDNGEGAAVEGLALALKKTFQPPMTIHFLDNVTDFAPPPDKLYGEEVIDKVILVFVKLKHREDFYWDPLNYKKYDR